MHGDVEIEIAVVVVIDKSDADAAFLAANAHFFSYVFELSCAIVVKKADAIGETDGEIRVTIVIEIPCGAAEAAAVNFEAGLLGDVGEFPLAEIVE